jgi:hypothetical protein
MIVTIVLRGPPAQTPSADVSCWPLLAVVVWLLTALLIGSLASRYCRPVLGRLDRSRRFSALLGGVYQEVERALRDPVLVIKPAADTTDAT